MINYKTTSILGKIAKAGIGLIVKSYINSSIIYYKAMNYLYKDQDRVNLELYDGLDIAKNIPTKLEIDFATNR